MVYASPSQGTIEFSWTGPLVVRGQQVATEDFPRFDNPFVQTAFDSEHYDVRYGRCTLSLDFTHASRQASGSPNT